MSWQHYRETYIGLTERGQRSLRCTQYIGVRYYARSWHRPPQHLRLPPRAVSSLCSLLRRIRRGMTTERDAWRVLSLVSRLDRAEGELRVMREGVGDCFSDSANRLNRHCLLAGSQSRQVQDH